MKYKSSHRAIALFICLLLSWSGVQAQLALGPQRLTSVPAPTLVNRTSLRVGLGARPRLTFVGRVGGVAFDGIATPTPGLAVNAVSLNYSPAKTDGERLSVTVNGQELSAPIYDWQLFPIAKFADSNAYSCFTLFGDLQDAELQHRVLTQGGRALNYHPAFVNTLMGLRLFQLDNLIINDYSYDLVKDGGRYLLGAGESAPDTDANQAALRRYRSFEEQNKQLREKGQSYIISDYRKQITFDLKGGRLNLTGEPSYYFWGMEDPDFLKRLLSGEAFSQIAGQLRSQAEAFRQRHPTASGRAWLIQQLLDDAGKYNSRIGNYQLLDMLGERHLIGLLSAKTPAARRALLLQQSIDDILMQLILLRAITNLQNAVEIPELNDLYAGRTEMLRAINPAVWDTAANLMRYAAFFRYCKQQNPRQWALFMGQVRRAPTLRPRVITPTILEAAPDRDQPHTS